MSSPKEGIEHPWLAKMLGQSVTIVIYWICIDFFLPLMHHHFLLMDIPFVHCVITSMISCTPVLDLMMMKFITGLSHLYNQVVSVSNFAILWNH